MKRSKLSFCMQGTLSTLGNLGILGTSFISID
jgi:hypothetical protein